MWFEEIWLCGKCDSRKCDSRKCDSRKCDSMWKCDSGKCDSEKCDTGKCNTGKCDSGKNVFGEMCFRANVTGEMVHWEMKIRGVVRLPFYSVAMLLLLLAMSTNHFLLLFSINFESNEKTWIKNKHKQKYQEARQEQTSCGVDLNEKVTTTAWTKNQNKI
jgi:hypothetical protein